MALCSDIIQHQRISGLMSKSFILAAIFSYSVLLRGVLVGLNMVQGANLASTNYIALWVLNRHSRFISFRRTPFCVRESGAQTATTRHPDLGPMYHLLARTPCSVCFFGFRLQANQISFYLQVIRSGLRVQ